MNFPCAVVGEEKAFLHALAHEAVLVTANRARPARVPGLRIEDRSRKI